MMEANCRKRRAAHSQFNLDSNQNKQKKDAVKDKNGYIGFEALPGEKAFKRQKIVREVVEDVVAPSDLANKYKFGSWVKKCEETLPKRYNEAECGVGRPPTTGPCRVDLHPCTSTSKEMEPRVSNGGFLNSDSRQRSHHEDGRVYVPLSLEEGAHSGLICPVISIDSFIFVEIETIKASNSDVKDITQIGCCSFGTKDMEKRFFKVIAPERLDHYLEAFKIDGDLLQLLHLQKNESGQFEFRKQFEIVKKGVEVPKCTIEHGALLSLALFLNSFSTECILVSINKETIELILERMKHFDIDYNFVKGFCTWNSFQEETNCDLNSTKEFDDWYTENINNVSSHLHAGTVAHMQKEAIANISDSISHGDSNKTSEILHRASSPIQFLFTSNSPENARITEGPLEFLELFNGLRPSCPAKITMSKMEILEISSEDEDLPQVSQSIPFANHGAVFQALNPRQNDLLQTSISTPLLDEAEVILISDTEYEIEDLIMLQRSRSPSRSVSRSPVRFVSRSPSRSVSRSPSRSVSRSPVRFVSRSPSRSVSRSPSRSVSRSPSRSVSRSPMKVMSIFSSRSSSRSPSRSVSRSPSKSVSRSPSASSGKDSHDMTFIC